MNPTHDRAMELFKGAGWSYDGDRTCFVSSDKHTTIDIDTAVQTLAEGGEDILKQFLNDAKGFGRLQYKEGE